MGAAVEEGRPILVNDIRQEPRYMGPAAQHAVAAGGADAAQGQGDRRAQPAATRRKGRSPTQDEALLRQFAAHVAVAIENARLFRSERRYVDTLETLAEIGREMSSILDLDALLTRIASLTKRLVDYRTLRHPAAQRGTQELEMKLAVRYGKGAESKHDAAGRGPRGLGGAAHARRCWCPTSPKDPRYINLVDDATSELGDPDADQGPLHRRLRPREP